VYGNEEIMLHIKYREKPKTMACSIPFRVHQWIVSIARVTYTEGKKVKKKEDISNR